MVKTKNFAKANCPYWLCSCSEPGDTWIHFEWEQLPWKEWETGAQESPTTEPFPQDQIIPKSLKQDKL